MRNHSQKAKDIAESVLPSTGRSGAAKARQRLHQQERARARAALRRHLADPESGDAEADGSVAGFRYRHEIAEFVWDRRAQDKVGSLCRWARRRVATRPELAGLDMIDRVQAFRQVLPDNLVGRHALSHIESALEWDRYKHSWPLPASPSYRELQFARLQVQLRVVLEGGLHGHLNQRIKQSLAGSDQPVRVLLGLHDLDAFAEHALCCPAIEEAIVEAATSATGESGAARTDSR